MNECMYMCVFISIALLDIYVRHLCWYVCMYVCMNVFYTLMINAEYIHTIHIYIHT